MFFVDNKLQMWLLCYINDGFLPYYGVGTVQKTDNKSIAVLFLNRRTNVLIMNELDMMKEKLSVNPLFSGQN